MSRRVHLQDVGELQAERRRVPACEHQAPAGNYAISRIDNDRKHEAELDISTPDAVADAAASIGFDRAALRAGIQCPETKAGLQRTVADAVARGFFGSPFIIVDGEPFWGADRLPMVERWLVSPW